MKHEKKHEVKHEKKHTVKKLDHHHAVLGRALGKAIHETIKHHREMEGSKMEGRKIKRTMKKDK